MSDADRARAYRLRKESHAASTVLAPKSSFAQYAQERTDAELLEAMRQALTEVRRHPKGKTHKGRLSRIVAEFARRYPNG